jgi:hypothetical protein
MTGPIAAPSRAHANDARPAWPWPAGGDSGIVAVPSRSAAVAGEGFPERPSLTPWARSGARGTIASVAHYSPTVDLTTPQLYNNFLGTPTARHAAHFVRHFVSAGAAVVGRFVAPRDGRTGYTLNNSEDRGAPLSPIPASARFVMWTLREPMNWGRVWNDYVPLPAPIQPNMAARRLVARTRLPRMQTPYYPRLTVMPAMRSYGADTTTLPGNSAPIEQSPYQAAYAGGAVLGRFSV